MKSYVRNQAGFTLVELMVVVAIIGILSAIAVPNFKKYQARSKTSEAKLQLSAAYTAQQSFFSDFETYHICLKYMGYDPANERLQRYYLVGFAGASLGTTDTTATNNGAQIGDGSTPGTCVNVEFEGETVFNAGKQVGTVAPMLVADVGSLSSVQPTESTFVIGAMGIISPDAVTAADSSNFTIDQNKKIVQVRAGF